MAQPRSRDRSLVPLADRLRWTQLNRTLLALLPVLAWWVLPQYRTDGAPAPFLAAGAVLAFVVLGTLVALIGRRATLVVLTGGLLIDGAYLAWAFHLLGGLDGPVGYLVIVHVSAVTLLTSFRSGVKLAAWEGLALLVVVQAEHDGLLGGEVSTEPLRTADLAVLVSVLGLAALGTAAYGAVNERELRRRRYDAQVLRDFAVDLEAAASVSQVAQGLLDLGCDDLGARGAAFLLVDDGAAGSGTSVVVGQFVRQCAPGAVEDRTPDREVPITSVLARSLADRSVEAVEVLDPERDGWLAEVLPGATRLVLVPVPGSARGVLLLAFGARDRRGRRRVPRRVVAAAEQALAHASLAISRIELIGLLTAAADRDGLTGVANRRRFDASLEDALAHTARTGAPCSVVLIDLDHFKLLNDTYGHLAGDEVLRAAATAMDGVCRAEELLARYGGEEFAVVLPGTTPEQALTLAERLRAAVASASPARPITASLGVAGTTGVSGVHGVTEATGTELLAAADAALYRAKAEGRDRCVVASGTADLVDLPA